MPTVDADKARAASSSSCSSHSPTERNCKAMPTPSLADRFAGYSLADRKHNPYTLVVIRDAAGQRVLLGLKKRGFGQGRWNGFGGKIEGATGETVFEAASREVAEECGLHVPLNDLTLVGRIKFEFANEPDIMDVTVFRVEFRSDWVPTETDEMLPQWFGYQDVPFDSMWADDSIWLPRVLTGQTFNGYVKFQGHDVMLEQQFQFDPAFLYPC